MKIITSFDCNACVNIAMILNKELTPMKATTILFSVVLSTALSAATLPAQATDLFSSLKDKVKAKKEEQKAPVSANALISYVAKELKMSEQTVTAGLGALLKVTKDNVSKDKFAMLTTALPQVNSYIEQAPSVSTSGLSSLLGSSNSAKKAESVSYVDEALKKLNIPKESLPALINTATGYLDKNGNSEAAALLKKSLSFI